MTTHPLTVSRLTGPRHAWDWLIHIIPLAMAATIVPSLVSLATGATVRLEPLVKLTGNQAEQLLVACLACTPLVILFGLNWAGRFRKPLGLWTAAFTAVHTVVYLAERAFQLAALTERTYLTLGLIAGLILMVLAITSNRWSMRRLGRGWKRLQQLVYLVAVLSVLHIALIHTFRLSPLAIQYGLLFLALLAVRLPPIRRRVIAWRQQLGRAAGGHWQPSA